MEVFYSLPLIIMTVKYNVTERKNPLDKTATSKFYANAKADGEIKLREIAKEIS